MNEKSYRDNREIERATMFSLKKWSLVLMNMGNYIILQAKDSWADGRYGKKAAVSR